jgi:hypothetical protein
MPKTLAAEPSNQYATLLLLTLGNELPELEVARLVGCDCAIVWLKAPSGEELALDGAAEEELYRGDCCMR